MNTPEELKALADGEGGGDLGDANPRGASVDGVVPPQIQPSPGLPERQAAKRRRQRVLDMMHTLPEAAQQAIKKMMDEEDGSNAASGRSDGGGSPHPGERQPTPSGRS